MSANEHRNYFAYHITSGVQVNKFSQRYHENPDDNPRSANTVSK